MHSIDEIRKLLEKINDPLLNQDLITLNMVDEIKVSDASVDIKLHLPAPGYTLEDELKKNVQEGLKLVSAQKTLNLTITSKPGPARPQTVREGLPGVKKIIAVYACKGGVGKSTVSTNLAVSLKNKGFRVGLLDADIHGPNIPLMMGIQDNPKGTKDKKLVPLEAHGIQLMSIGFLTNTKLPSIWRGPMVHGAIQQLLRDTAWDNLDYLIIDLPPGTGDAQLTIIQSAPLSGVVFVTTPQAVSLADGIKGIGLFQRFGVPILGIIENMSGFTCPHCDEVTNIFSKGGGEAEAKAHDFPFLGQVPLDPEIVRGGDGGKPIVLLNPKAKAAQEFGKIAENILNRIGALKGSDFK